MATESKRAEVKELPAPPPASDVAIWDMWLSQHRLPAITVAIEVGLFTHVEAAAPQGASPGDVAKALLLPLRGVDVLMAYLAALKLLAPSGAGRFALTATARSFLLPTSAFNWAPMLMGDSSAEAHRRLKRVLETDRPDGAAEEWESGGDALTAARARHLTSEMHAHSLQAALVAAEVAKPLFDGDGAVTALLDVAGGSGVFSTAFVQRYGGLKATVAELPVVCELLNAEYLAPSGRVSTVSMDMFTADWPTGFDGVFMSNVLHDWDDAQCLNLAQRAFKALPPGGRLLLHEQLLAHDAVSPETAAAFSMHMLIHTRGKQRTLPELTALLTAAGFQDDVYAVPAHGYYSVVVATKASA